MSTLKVLTDNTPEDQDGKFVRLMRNTFQNQRHLIGEKNILTRQTLRKTLIGIFQSTG